MKNLKTAILLLLLAVAIIPAYAQEKYSKVKIYNDARDPFAQRKFIYGDLQVDHCHFEDGGFIVELSKTEVKKLKTSGYKYKILIDDMAENFRRTNDVSKFFESDREQSRPAFMQTCKQVANIIPTPTRFGPGTMGGYYTYSQMDSIMTVLEIAHPTLIDKFSIGTTLQGRTIWAVKISDNVTVDENEPEVMFNALQHCREAISGTSQIFFMEYLLQYYGVDPKITQLLNNREIFIIPCSNPDGYVYNQTTNPNGAGNWRKNRRDLLGDSTEFGVDLNRNYNADWGNCNPPVGGIVASCGNGAITSANATYWGTGPFSENETAAIRDFTAAHNFRMSIDQHSEGAYNTVPHGRFSLHPIHNSTDSLFLYGFSSSIMATYDCHRIGNNLQTLNYEVAGGNKDWMFQGATSMSVNPRKVYSFTSEAGGGTFWPVASQIIPLAKGLTFQYLQAVLAAGANTDIQDVNDVVLTTKTGNMRYLIMRAGILTAPITVALLPLENMTGAGIPVTLPAATLPVYNDTISGNISYTLPAALTNGQRVRFIWRVTTDGISVDDTVTKFYNPVSILYDDMETGVVGTKWTVSSGWNYTTTKAFAGTKSISESPVGNYPASTTRSITYVSAIDLSDATAAYLSFWVRHRSENCRDNLRIQISTNGGGSYTSVCGRHTVSEMDGTLAGQPALTGIRENWTKELVDLNSFKGAGMNNIRLRFLFTSNADDPADDYYKEQDDGFYLDNIRLMKSIVPLVTLPVHFLSFEGKLLADGTAELTWDAEVDNLHDHFEVQKSLDGYNFVTLGTANPNPPYKFIDASVANGRNTYRIKQVDKDGTITYSKLVNIYVDLGKASIVVYPNPVSGVMKVSFNATGGELYTVTLSNLMGKKIHEEKVITGNSAKVIEINLAGKPSQVFMLVVRNARNEIVTTEKIIKH